jgi:cell wall-associated NlpC family hydrolase
MDTLAIFYTGSAAILLAASPISSAANSIVDLSNEETDKVNIISLIPTKAPETFMEKEAQRAMILKEIEDKKAKEINKNTKDLRSAVSNAMFYIDKTWYVFSGSTPQGWDCSGLVMWTYAQLEIDLYHSATAQRDSGVLVSTPKFGDIVSFSWTGQQKSYHVGIYIDKDTMLHSGGKKGDKTELRSISGFAGKNSTVQYVRVIETN